MIAKTLLKLPIETYYVICVLICATGILYLTVIKSTYTTESKLLSQTSLHRPQCSYVGFEIPKVLAQTGLGNHLFYYSGVMYVSWLTGRRPCFCTTLTYTRLESVFDVDILHVNVSMTDCPLSKFVLPGTGIYDRRVESLVNIKETNFLLLEGYFQSWKFVEPIASQLRQKLIFRQELTEFVADFMATNVPHSSLFV